MAEEKKKAPTKTKKQEAKASEDSCCAQDNCCADKRTLITVASLIVALVSIVYALMIAQPVEKPSTITALPAVEVEEVEYKVTVSNPVVLEVNGQTVTRDEIMDMFKASGSKLPEGQDEKTLFPMIQEQFLISRLLLNASKDLGYSKDDPKIAMQMKNALDQAIRAAYIEELLKDSVSESDIRNAYKDVIGKTPAIKERKASHILLSDKEKADKIIEELKAGGDFAELAKKHSQGPTGKNGGDLGFFAQNEMVPPFAAAAFALDLGSFTQSPVQTQFGWHVIKVEDERERPKLEFDSVKEQLESQLRQGVLAAKLDELRQGAEITMYTYNGQPVPTTSDMMSQSKEEQEEGEKPDTADEEPTAAEQQPDAPVAAE